MVTQTDAPLPLDGRAVAIFIMYLNELPLETWVETARHRAASPKTHDAETTLNVIIRQLDHHRDVFATRQAVLDALHRFECAEGRRLTRSRNVTAHLRPMTETAALAVLVRARLSPEDFETLYAPFEPVIPSLLLVNSR